jgi:hypothetical protein
MRLLAIPLFASLLTYVLSVECKDGSYCPGDNTCCLTPRGVGCCPYKDATCCGDGIHCCPNGYVCNTRGGCSRGADKQVLAMELFNPYNPHFLKDYTKLAEELQYKEDN